MIKTIWIFNFKYFLQIPFLWPEGEDELASVIQSNSAQSSTQNPQGKESKKKLKMPAQKVVGLAFKMSYCDFISYVQHKVNVFKEGHLVLCQSLKRNNL